MNVIQFSDNIWVRTDEIIAVRLTETTVTVLVRNGHSFSDRCADCSHARKTAEDIVKELEALE